MDTTRGCDYEVDSPLVLQGSRGAVINRPALFAGKFGTNHRACSIKGWRFVSRIAREIFRGNKIDGRRALARSDPFIAPRIAVIVVLVNVESRATVSTSTQFFRLSVYAVRTQNICSHDATRARCFIMNRRARLTGMLRLQKIHRSQIYRMRHIFGSPSSLSLRLESVSISIF